MGMMPQQGWARGSRALWGRRVLQWFPGYAVGFPRADLPPPQKNWARLGAPAYSALVYLLFLNARRALNFSNPVPQPSICTLLTPQGPPGWPASTLLAVSEVGRGRTGSQCWLLFPCSGDHASLAAPCARPASTQAPASEESSLSCCYKWRAALTLSNCSNSKGRIPSSWGILGVLYTSEARNTGEIIHRYFLWQ